VEIKEIKDSILVYEMSHIGKLVSYFHFFFFA